MKDSELEDLKKMIEFFLSKTKTYWNSHPDEFHAIYTELSLIVKNAN